MRIFVVNLQINSNARNMGIYVHVPFCRSKCFYCGFYSVASLKLKEAYLDALAREIGIREGYLPGGQVETLYLGGGTPSYLEIGDLRRVVGLLEQHYRFIPGAERTIELNPEDLTEDKLKGLLGLNFNRLSIGVQSFSDIHLKQINRTHSAAQAIAGVRLAKDMGFDNISVDLIIGLPGQTELELLHDVDIAGSLPVKHLSVYMLSVDSNTVFEVMMKQGKLRLEPDEVIAERYEMVCQRLKHHGFEHYEISNFARNGLYSKHNTSYWQQKPYIGFGPSAHSYDLHSRQWNTANLKTYIESLNNGVLPFEIEELTSVNMYNEYVMTNLRTMWGIDVAAVERLYGTYWETVRGKVMFYISNGDLIRDNDRLCITEKGWMVSDAIMSDLFVVSE